MQSTLSSMLSCSNSFHSYCTIFVGISRANYFLPNFMISLVRHYPNALATCSKVHAEDDIQAMYDSILMGFILFRVWYLIFSLNFHPALEALSSKMSNQIVSMISSHFLLSLYFASMSSKITFFIAFCLIITFVLIKNMRIFNFS